MKKLNAATLVWILVVSVVVTSLPATVALGAGNTPVAVTDATLSTSEIEAGGTVTVTAIVTNTGETNETPTVSLQVDDAVRQTTEVSVPANGTQTVSFTESFDSAGSYELAVNDVPAGTLSVVEPPQSELAVTNVTLSAASVFEDTETRVFATVANTGDAAGTTTLELEADGTVVDTSTVSVAAGTTARATFTPTFEDPGNYTLAVDGVTGGTLAVLDDPMLIEECTTIDEPGHYRLGEDLTAPSTTESCIAITSSHVTLDGQGYTLDGTDGYSSANKTVHYGVDVTGSKDAPLTDVRIENLVVTEWTHGVNLDGVADVAIVDVTGDHNRVGIALRRAQDTAILGGQYVDNAKHGVRVRGHSENVKIGATTIDANGARGIYANNVNTITITGNTIDANAAGVFVRDVIGTTVRGNTLGDNQEGVVLIVTNGSTVANNDVAGGDVGILVRATHGHGSDGHDSGDDLDSTDHTHETTDTNTTDTNTTDTNTTDTDVTTSSTDDSHDDHESGDSHDGCEHEDVVPGATTVTGNTVTGSTVGISLVGTANDTLTGNTVTSVGSWAVHLEAGATDVQITDLELEDDRIVDLRGSDIGVRAVAAPTPAPAGYMLVGGGVELAETSSTGTVVALDLGYDSAAADSTAAHSVLGVWRHDGTDWTLVGAPTDWRYDTEAGHWHATGIDGTTVDEARNRVSTVPDSFGVFAPMAGQPTTSDLTVTAGVTPTTVDDGEPVTVTAEVATNGSEQTAAILDLTVDGDVVERTQTNVTPEEPSTVNFTQMLDPGRYDLAVSGVDTGTVVVRDITAPKPFAITHTARWVATPIEFDATGSTDDVGIVRYTWNFDDGATATGSEVTHTFWRPGTYDVRLTVTDAAGNQASDTLPIKVTWKPEPSTFSLPDEPRVDVRPLGDGRNVVSIGFARLEPEIRVPLGLQGTNSSVTLDELTLATTDVNWYQLTVQQTASAPAGTPAWTGSNGPAFGYFVIDAPDGAVKNVTHTFQLSTASLDERGLQPADVVLYHYEDGRWAPLETRATDVNDGRVTFVAESPSLSVFAVGTTTPDITTTAMTLDTTSVIQGEQVQASVTYRNDGAADGDVVVELAVDGVVYETRTITVAAGQRETVVFEPVLDSAGQHAISIGGAGVGAVDVEAVTTTAPTVTTTAETPAGEEPEPAASGIGFPGLVVLGGLAALGAYLLLRR